MLRALTSVLVCIAILVGCNSEKQKLIKDGFQVFDYYGIAVKMPCELILDHTNTLNDQIGVTAVLVCPQIFTDTSRTTFYLDRIMESDRTINQLAVVIREDELDLESKLILQKKILTHIGIVKIEDIFVDGRKALLYDIENKHTTESYMTYEKFVYRISVSGDSSNSKLRKVLKEVRIGEFD